VYLFNVERWKPAAFFGLYQDDGIYLSTAKALAEGQGYTLISFPGSPPAMKYPILYPWLLSFVWRLNPNFPDNLKLAIHVTKFFGCWTLIATFFLLRRLEGLSEWVAISFTALFACQPFFVRLSGLVMSDVPFMALMLTALLMAGAAIRTRGGLLPMVFAGLTAGLLVGIRIIGVAVVAGILFVVFRSKGLRSALIFACSAFLAAIAVLWPTLSHPTAVANISSPGELGWKHVLTNYTQYGLLQGGLSLRGLWMFLVLVKLNFLVLLTSPGTIVAGPSGPWGARIMATLSAPIWLGIIRQWRQPEWRPITSVVIFYVGILLVWPYTIPDRFLLPFIPLFFASLWCELRRLGHIVVTNVRSGAPTGQRILAASLSAVLASILAFIAWNYLFEDPKRLRDASELQMRALVEKQQAYQWIREHTNPGDRIVSWEDVTLYLYTGRQALRPIAILPQVIYMADPQALQRDLDHICDAPRYVGARLWVTKEDDFKLEEASDEVAVRMSKINAVLPLIFSSRRGYVQIHNASCVAGVSRPECRAAAPVLFPYLKANP
jgi:hypothetical protein